MWHGIRVTVLNIETLRAQVNEGIARHGLRGFARKLGLQMGTLRSLRDGRDIQSSKLLSIVGALGLELRVVPARGSDGDGFGEPDRMNRTSNEEALHSGYLPIPFHPATRIYSGSAPVAFSRHWLNQQGLTPEHLYCLTIEDDRMSPVIRQGALCLIDAGMRRVTEYRVWAYLERGRLSVGYLGQPAAGAMIIADAVKLSPPRVLTGPDLDAIQPIGRIIWSGGSMHGPPVG